MKEEVDERQRVLCGSFVFWLLLCGRQCDAEVTQDAEGVSKAEMELKDEYKTLVKLQHEISEEVKFTMVLFSSLHAPFSLFLCAPSPTHLTLA